MKKTRSEYMLGKVEEWKNSGLSKGEFSRKNGFSKTGFDYWVQKNHKISDLKDISFIELAPGGKPKEIVDVSSESPEPTSHQGSIVITFPGGMSVTIYG